MMKKPLLVVSLILAGCGGIPPQRVMENAPRFERVASLPPAEASMCISRNAEGIAQYFTQRAPLDSNGGVEVVVNWAQGFTSAVLHVRPAPSGSTITLGCISINSHGAMRIERSFWLSC